MSRSSDWDTGRIGDFFEPGRAYTTQPKNWREGLDPPDPTPEPPPF